MSQKCHSFEKYSTIALVLEGSVYYFHLSSFVQHSSATTWILAPNTTSCHGVMRHLKVSLINLIIKFQPLKPSSMGSNGCLRPATLWNLVKRIRDSLTMFFFALLMGFVGGNFLNNSHILNPSISGDCLQRRKQSGGVIEVGWDVREERGEQREKHCEKAPAPSEKKRLPQASCPLLLQHFHQLLESGMLAKSGLKLSFPNF